MIGAWAEGSDGRSPFNNGATNSGAAYVFVGGGAIWQQQAFLKAQCLKTGHGFGPSVASSSPPKLNTVVSLTLTGGRPGAAPVMLAAGLSPLALPFDGGTLLVDPAFFVAIPSLDRNGEFALTVPVAASACGLHLYLQAMFVDQDVVSPYQTAQTNGLDWTLGD